MCGMMLGGWWRSADGSRPHPGQPAGPFVAWPPRARATINYDKLSIWTARALHCMRRWALTSGWMTIDAEPRRRPSDAPPPYSTRVSLPCRPGSTTVPHACTHCARQLLIVI